VTCSHAFAFHNELNGAMNIHCDEILTTPPIGVSHLRVRRSALCYAQPLTDFCAYKLVPVTMWNSARTSVTAALMSMAMASILKVCLMRRKGGNGYCAKAKGTQAAGEEEEKY